jgi:hypothetical protein
VTGETTKPGIRAGIAEVPGVAGVVALAPAEDRAVVPGAVGACGDPEGSSRPVRTRTRTIARAATAAPAIAAALLVESRGDYSGSL